MSSERIDWSGPYPTHGPPARVGMPAVFINYRTGDEEASAALIERELSRRFGSAKIFRAEKSIAPGDDIETTIMEAVRHCKALVAVIGPRWLTATGPDGRHAIDSHDDWTRRELVEARRHGVRVIPLLIGKVGCLTRSDVPSALGWLPGCKYLRLNYRDLDGCLDRLAEQLTELVPALAVPALVLVPPLPPAGDAANGALAADPSGRAEGGGTDDR